jgi:hypothetical protein
MLLSQVWKGANKDSFDDETLPIKNNKEGVCHTVALPFALKSILIRQKKNDGNSNISPCKNIIV